jgi:hypothetical protein
MRAFARWSDPTWTARARLKAGRTYPTGRQGRGRCPQVIRPAGLWFYADEEVPPQRVGKGDGPYPLEALLASPAASGATRPLTQRPRPAALVNLGLAAGVATTPAKLTPGGPPCLRRSLCGCRILWSGSVPCVGRRGPPPRRVKHDGAPGLRAQVRRMAAVHGIGGFGNADAADERP